MSGPLFNGGVLIAAIALALDFAKTQAQRPVELEPHAVVPQGPILVVMR